MIWVMSPDIGVLRDEGIYSGFHSECLDERRN